jgi:hypothetical protein
VTDQGAALVTRALRRGVRVVWNPAPKYRGPAEAIALVKETPEFAREVLRRAALFRQQVATPGVIPFVRLPNVTGWAGGCLSCGVPAAGLRCQACQLAAWLALDMTPPEGCA